ncbi:MAG TPA: RHS repeat domain-containing protein [Rhizomicrobium sp.]|nr:RHS repeat domain-containing protein [Rhizomicrobium sp.]
MRKTVALCFAIAITTISRAEAGVSYQYDTLGRLSSASYDNGRQIVYTYDPAGNRTQVVTQATPPHAALANTPKKASSKHRPKHAKAR